MILVMVGINMKKKKGKENYVSYLTYCTENSCFIQDFISKKLPFLLL